jgi:hypothetical protein
MGGKGSGRRRGFTKRRTVQDFGHRAFHISALKGFRHKPGYFIYPWETSEQLIGSVRLWIQDRYIEVSYREPDSTKWVEQTVLLEGGKRYWFRCPTCNRRAGTLFIVGPPFGCRVCMELAYESQRQSAEERIRTRAPAQHILNRSTEGFDYGLRDEDLTTTSIKSSANQARPPNSRSFTFDNPDY